MGKAIETVAQSGGCQPSHVPSKSESIPQGAPVRSVLKDWMAQGTALHSCIFADPRWKRLHFTAAINQSSLGFQPQGWSASDSSAAGSTSQRPPSPSLESSALGLCTCGCTPARAKGGSLSLGLAISVKGLLGNPAGLAVGGFVICCWF